MRKVYRLKNGVRLISARSAFGKSAAVWMTWSSAPMQMPREQIAAWLRVVRRENYLEAVK